MGQIINRGRNAPQRKEGSLMRKIQDFVLNGKEIFVGLEDSKKSWKVWKIGTVAKYIFRICHESHA